MEKRWGIVVISLFRDLLKMVLNEREKKKGEDQG